MSGNGRAATRGDGEVIELECGITVYPARSEGGRWRAVWHEDGQRRQCEAATEGNLTAKLEMVRVRLEADAPKMRQPGAALIAHYLAPDRLPVSKRWSRKHAHSQGRLCALYAAPVIGEVTCQDIKTGHMQQIVNAAPTAGEGDRVQRMISALVTAGIDAGYLVSGGSSMSTLELSQSAPAPLRMPAQTVELPRLPAVSSAADSAIRASTAAVVLAVAGIAAYISYWHAYAVVRQYGESGVTALLEPGTIDGLVYASLMVILYAARHWLLVPRLARWMLALGIAASLAVYVAQGWSHGLAGAAAAAWPAVALVGSYELLAWMIRTTAGGGPDPDRVSSPDRAVPLPDQPEAIRRPAVSLMRETVAAAASWDGASPQPESAHEGFPVACAAAQVRGPGPGGPGCTGQADRGNQAGGPARESTGPGGAGGPAAPGPSTSTAPDDDIDAAAVAAYRASLREDLTAVGA